jgi:hypothetical protein
MPVLSKTEQIIAVVNAILTQLPEKVRDCPKPCEEGVWIARFITLYMRGRTLHSCGGYFRRK